MLFNICVLVFLLKKSRNFNSSLDGLLFKLPAAVDFVEERVYSLYAFKSGNPEISPGGVQNEKIENP